MHFDGTNSHRTTNKPEKSENISFRPNQTQKFPAERSGRNEAAALKRRDVLEQKPFFEVEAHGGMLPLGLISPLVLLNTKTGLLFVIQDRYLPDMGVVSSDLGQGICESWIAKHVHYLSFLGQKSSMLLYSPCL